MKVLFFADRPYPTDHSFLESLVEDRVTLKGIDVTWVMYNGRAAKTIEFKKWKRSNVILVPNARQRDPWSLYLNAAVNSRRLETILEDNYRSQFDLFIVRNDISFLRLAIKLARKSDKRVFFQLSHLKAEQFLAGSPDNSILRDASEWLKGAGGLFLREMVAPKADAIFCISGSMRNYLSQKKRYRQTPLYVLPLGVDIRKVDRQKKLSEHVGFPIEVDSGFSFVYCGTMAAIRRLDQLLYAFKMAVASTPDINLVLVGGGREPKQVSALKALAKKLRISERVFFAGQLSREQTRSILCSCNAGLCITPPIGVLKHISPTKIMEYMEVSLPVIATKGVPEQEEIIEGSNGGLLVEFRIDDVSSAMVRLATHQDEARVLGRNGRAYIEHRRNYDKMANWFVEVLEGKRC